MKRLNFFPLVTLLIFLILSVNVSAKIKAVQISYLNCKDLKGFEKELVKIGKAGYNTVIFRVFNNKGDRIYPFAGKIFNREGVYFKTNYAPLVSNLLPLVARLCHKNNLKIVAWLTTRYLGFSRNRGLTSVLRFDFQKNSFEKGKGLSFFSNKNIKYIADVFADLAAYNIDGILLQDDVKILIDEDFNGPAIKSFKEETGILLNAENVKKILYSNAVARNKVPASKNLEIWNKIKSRQINTLLNTIVDSCKKRKKKLKLFMNVNYETLYRPRLSMLWYSYDFSTLSSVKIDYFVVMLYQRQIMKELHLSEQETDKFIFKVIKSSSKIVSPEKIVYKIQTYDWYTNKLISFNSLNKLFTFFVNNNILNIAIFPYNEELTLFKFQYK